MGTSKKVSLKKRMIAKSYPWISRIAFGKEKVTKIQSFYDIIDTDIEGNQVNMAQYRGKVILVMNVASK